MVRRPFPFSRRARWTIAVAAFVALGAAIWLTPAARARLVPWASPGPRPELQELVAAVAAQRPVEGRLMGGFAWGPLQGPPRGDAAPPPGRQRDARYLAAATALLARSMSAGASPEALTDRATALLLLDRTEEAIEALEDATSEDPLSAPAWSDLAATYVARFSAGGPATDLPRALDAVERALALSPGPEALFNRAVVLERLNLTEAATGAWDDYLRLDRSGDPSSGWIAEARGRRDLLTKHIADVKLAAGRQSARERLADDLLYRWASADDSETAKRLLDEARAQSQAVVTFAGDRLAGDLFGAIDAASLQPLELSAIAEAHRAYGLARAAYRRDAYEESDKEMAEVLRASRRAPTPLTLLARLYRGIIRYRLNDSPGAERQLVALIADPQIARYPSIGGRARWTLGLLATLSGRHREAIRLYAEATRALERADEQPNVGFVRMLHAAQFEHVGDLEGAWRARVQAFALIDREAPIQSAAQSAANAGWPAAASALYDVVIAKTRTTARDTIRADALQSRARALVLVGELDRARDSLLEGRRLADAHPEPGWDPLRAEMALAEAEVDATRAPAAAVHAAGRALDYFAANARALRVPEALLARARAHRAAGDLPAAMTDLETGIDAMDRLRVQLDEWRLRALLGDVVQRFGDELLALQVNSDRAMEALQTAERLRGWELRARAGGTAAPFAPDELSRSMPADTTLVWFSVNAEETYAWILGRGRTRFVRIPASRRRLGTLVRRHAGTDLEAGRELRRLLLGPLDADLRDAHRLVIVPDGPLHLLAFATLPGRTARFLVEEQVLLISPNASAFAASLAGPPPSGRDTALVVGNPSFDREFFSSLRPLPEAVEEAAAVSRFYAPAVVLTGTAATHAAILEALPRHGVFHFAGHSLGNSMAPGESQLVVAGPPADAITASDISRLRLSGLRLVVLSSCDSVAGQPSRAEGPLGMARAFLSAGARSVVASQTPVGDRAARELATAFHRAFLASGDAAEALQEAQLALLRSGDPALAAPAAWGTFVVIGSR
jgi:CHAT domain-containing protein